MCSYSMIAGDWMNPDGPNYINVPGFQVFPNPLPLVPLGNPPPVTPDVARHMLDILKRVDELDKKLGRLDCKLDEIQKKRYVDALRKTAGKKCVCKKKKAKKKYPRHNVSAGGTRGGLGHGKPNLLQE